MYLVYLHTGVDKSYLCQVMLKYIGIARALLSQSEHSFIHPELPFHQVRDKIEATIDRLCWSDALLEFNEPTGFKIVENTGDQLPPVSDERYQVPSMDVVKMFGRTIGPFSLDVVHIEPAIWRYPRGLNRA